MALTAALVIGSGLPLPARSPATSAEPWAGIPGVPSIDAATAEHIQALVEAGATQGERPAVFIKVGDSITSSCNSLCGFSGGHGEFGDYADLQPAALRWCNQVIDGASATSCNRASFAAVPGAGAGYLLTPCTAAGCFPGESFLGAELREIRPQVALVEVGTNDWAFCGGELGCFATGLIALVERIEQAGVVPVLSTIPQRPGLPHASMPVADVNAAIREIGENLRLPVMDFHLALERFTAGEGLGADGIHPSTCPDGAADLSPRCLAYGFNVRNLLALASLARVSAVIDGTVPADPPAHFEAGVPGVVSPQGP